MTARNVARRFTMLAAAVLAIAALAVAFSHGLVDAPPGDYATRRGDQRLADRQWADAAAWFDRALAEAPDHAGAAMGKAIALLNMGEAAAAEAAFSRLIARLEERLAAGGSGAAERWRGMLAAAHANRGIIRDRAGRSAEALADYRAALAIDAGAVSGPGISQRIVSGNAHPSSVAKRAAYLERQLALPEAERRLLVPELDARQRMHRP
jgi:tetratricopeptide (TPR) repeat protein